LLGRGPVKIQPWERSPGLGFPRKFLERFEGDFLGIRRKIRTMKFFRPKQVVDRLSLENTGEDDEIL